MVATMMRVCSTRSPRPPTPHRAAAAPGPGPSRWVIPGQHRPGGVHPGPGITRGDRQRLPQQRPVEVQPCLSAMPRVSISPARWTCAAYTNRLTRSKPWANTSRSGSGPSRTRCPAPHPTPRRPPHRGRCRVRIRDLTHTKNATNDHRQCPRTADRKAAGQDAGTTDWPIPHRAATSPTHERRNRRLHDRLGDPKGQATSMRETPPPKGSMPSTPARSPFTTTTTTTTTTTKEQDRAGTTNK